MYLLLLLFLMLEKSLLSATNCRAQCSVLPVLLPALHTANTPLTKRHRATAGRVLAQIMPGFLRLGAPEVGNEGRKRGPRWLLTPGRYNGRFVTVFFYYVKKASP